MEKQILATSDDVFIFIGSRIFIEDKGLGDAHKEHFVVTSFPDPRNHLIRIHSLCTRRAQFVTLEVLLSRFLIGRAASAQDWIMAGVDQVEDGPYEEDNGLFCELNERFPSFE